MRMFKFFTDYDKEEKWLREMAEKGFELESASCGYNFRRIKPGNTVIRIDYRTFKNTKDFIDYCTLFEDSGWKHIAGTRHSGAQYFKKITNNSEEDIFSDAASRAGKYKRLSDMWMTLALSYFPIFVALVSTGTVDINQILNPRLLYYTPGLWDMTGARFLSAFLFETPFVLLRGFFWAAYLALIILYLSFAAKAKRLYYKSKKSGSI